MEGKQETSRKDPSTQQAYKVAENKGQQEVRCVPHFWQWKNLSRPPTLESHSTVQNHLLHKRH